MYDGVASAVGAIVFGKLIPEAVYDAHLKDGETDCYGAECFRLNFWIVFGLLCSALVSVGVLIMRIAANTAKK